MRKQKCALTILNLQIRTRLNQTKKKRGKKERKEVTTKEKQTTEQAA